MPEYVATLARNERHYSKWHFEAPDDQKAEAILKECEAAGTIPWEPDDETGDADALDPILWLDRCGGPGGTREEVACEIEFPGEVYTRDLNSFAKRVAALAQQDAYVDAGATLNTVIHEAIALLAGAKA